jgi:AbrB family looped-hinge helix DNA binding protein
MAKVTSKLQMTVPKAIADRYGIRPGDELEWTPAGEAIRVTPARRRQSPSRDRLNAEARLNLFDQATERQQKRQRRARRPARARDRGWTRQDLYARARPR